MPLITNERGWHSSIIEHLRNIFRCLFRVLAINSLVEYVKHFQLPTQLSTIFFSHYLIASFFRPFTRSVVLTHHYHYCLLIIIVIRCMIANKETEETLKKNKAKLAHLIELCSVVSMAFYSLISFVNKVPSWVIKKTMNRKVRWKIERKRARKKLAVRTVKNYFPPILPSEN